MKKVLETVIINLIDNKDALEITETIEDKDVKYVVKVDQNDMGRVIGKQGRLAKSIRTLIKALASKEQKRVTVEFIY